MDSLNVETATATSQSFSLIIQIIGPIIAAFFGAFFGFRFAVKHESEKKKKQDGEQLFGVLTAIKAQYNTNLEMLEAAEKVFIENIEERKHQAPPHRLVTHVLAGNLSILVLLIKDNALLKVIVDSIAYIELVNRVLEDIYNIYQVNLKNTNEIKVGSKALIEIDSQDMLKQMAKAKKDLENLIPQIDNYLNNI